MEIKDNILKEVRENDIKNGKFYVAESIICIDNKAFQYCTNLDEIYIAEGVKTIGDDAFAYCRNLKNIQLPDGITGNGGNWKSGRFSFLEIWKLGRFSFPIFYFIIFFSWCKTLKLEKRTVPISNFHVRINNVPLSAKILIKIQYYGN